MALSRRIARPLLASIFVVGGWDALWNPEGKAKKAEAVSQPLSETVGVDQLDAKTLVRINGAVQIGGGALLALGKYRRLAALVLIGSIVPTTYAGHRFWEESDPATRAQQKMHVLKNLGLLGGLILAAFDTEGEPSLGWRAKRQAREFETAVGVGRAKARRARKKVSVSTAAGSKAGKRTIRQGRAVRRRAGERLAARLDLAHKVAPGPVELRHARDGVADAVRDSSGTATHAVQQAASIVSDAVRQLEPLARDATHAGLDAIAPYVASGTERTVDALSKVREHLPVDLSDRASSRDSPRC
jgi:putative oxidoreductase